MDRITIDAPNIATLVWHGEALVDWLNGGNRYQLDGSADCIGSYHFGLGFDRAIDSADGQFVVLYLRLGTKAIILKNGEFLRELNRSHYHAEAYDYPIALATRANGQTVLIHCPAEYCRLDIEDAETGECLTADPRREPRDFFHSRLRVSPTGKSFLSRGWRWHPQDIVYCFNLEACLANPQLLDEQPISPPSDAEICAADYVDEDHILIGADATSEPYEFEPSDLLKPGQIALWNWPANTVSKPINMTLPISGHLYPIDDHRAWDLYQYPKIIDFHSGEVLASIEEINAGQQQSSISWGCPNEPLIAFHQETKQLAIAQDGKIEVLTPHSSEFTHLQKS